MPLHSAGILLYRRRPSGPEIFLVHPGGPFWAKKDFAAWSIPKGLIDPQEDPLAAAVREFEEETGFAVDGNFHSLGTFRLPSGKRLTAWALEGDCDPKDMKPGHFEMVWPPKSGKTQMFPEADRGAWFARAEAEVKIGKGQKQILEVFFRLYDTRGA
jgi:predicted NUDIX family NTP pyrophosphohydrolase